MLFAFEASSYFQYLNIWSQTHIYGYLNAFLILTLRMCEYFPSILRPKIKTILVIFFFILFIFMLTFYQTLFILFLLLKLIGLALCYSALPEWLGLYVAKIKILFIHLRVMNYVYHDMITFFSTCLIPLALRRKQFTFYTIEIRLLTR